MKLLLSRLLGRTGDFSDVRTPARAFPRRRVAGRFSQRPVPAQIQTAEIPARSLLWTLYSRFSLLLWALFIVGFLIAGMSVLRSYLHQTVANFQRNHGRVTEANYNAVQTIWGAEQTQGELKMDLYYEEEVTERIESEDLTKPAVLRKKIVRHNITSNPVRLRPPRSDPAPESAQKRLRALWRLRNRMPSSPGGCKNPTDRALNADIEISPARRWRDV